MSMKIKKNSKADGFIKWVIMPGLLLLSIHARDIMRSTPAGDVPGSGVFATVMCTFGFLAMLYTVLDIEFKRKTDKTGQDDQ